MGRDFQFEQIQEQRQSFSQTQIQALKLLAMPAQELKDFLIDVSYSNPMIELIDVVEEDPYPSCSRRTDPSDPYDIVENTQADNVDDFSELLLQQIRFLKLSRREAVICAYIVQNLDSKGWLDISIEDIAEDLSVSRKDAEKALKKVQSLNPAGVAARSLAECLLLQLQREGQADSETELLINDGLELIETGDIKAIAKLLGCDCSHALEKVKLIKKLNPIPSAGVSDGEVTEYIVPDASVFVSEGKLVLKINSSYIPRPVYSDVYRSLRKDVSGEDRKYLSQMKRDAAQIISGYERRIETFRKVMEVIVSLQAGYFCQNGSLCPMRMQDIASAIDMSVSTVSRAVSNKYVQCSSGTVKLSSLFTQGLESYSGSLSSADVKKKLQNIISREETDDPLSDEQIRRIMQKEGLQISRRTVAKYREQMKIPPAFKRRRLYLFRD